MGRSPVVALNRAIALARVEGPVAALAEVETIATDRTLDAYHLLPAVQAELWRDAGDPPRAAAYYRTAITLAACAPERKFLAARLASLVASAAEGSALTIPQSPRLVGSVLLARSARLGPLCRPQEQWNHLRAAWRSEGSAAAQSSLGRFYNLPTPWNT